jgi:hypothetical protein
LAGGGANRLVEMQAPLWLAMRSPADQRLAAYREVVTRLYADRHWTDLWVALQALAAHWADNERPEQAAILIGYLDAAGAA